MACWFDIVDEGDRVIEGNIEHPSVCYGSVPFFIADCVRRGKDPTKLYVRSAFNCMGPATEIYRAFLTRLPAFSEVVILDKGPLNTFYVHLPVSMSSAQFLFIMSCYRYLIERPEFIQTWYHLRQAHIPRTLSLLLCTNWEIVYSPDKQKCLSLAPNIGDHNICNLVPTVTQMKRAHSIIYTRNWAASKYVEAQQTLLDIADYINELDEDEEGNEEFGFKLHDTLYGIEHVPGLHLKESQESFHRFLKDANIGKEGKIMVPIGELKNAIRDIFGEE